MDSFWFQVNYTKYNLVATDLRLNYHYVLWYSNVARLIITGIVPVASLSYLNYRIYAQIKKRGQFHNHRPQNNSANAAAQKVNYFRPSILRESTNAAI